MGLVELGRHSGLSPALLSKLERGKLFPTLPTLLRIALVFSVGLEYFFAAGRERRTFGIVRKADRRRFPEEPEVKEPSVPLRIAGLRLGRAAHQCLLRGVPALQGAEDPHPHPRRRRVHLHARGHAGADHRRRDVHAREGGLGLLRRSAARTATAARAPGRATPLSSPRRCSSLGWPAISRRGRARPG